MTLRERALDDLLDEIPLPVRIRLAKGKPRCAVLTCKATLEFLVFACSRGVLAPVIPKCQRALLLLSPRLNDVHMMRVWPSAGPMSEPNVTRKTVRAFYERASNPRTCDPPRPA